MEAGVNRDFTLADTINEYPGLTEDSACRWAIKGFTVEGWFHHESNYITIADYIDRLRTHIDYLKNTIRDLQDAATYQNNQLTGESP